MQAAQVPERVRGQPPQPAAVQPEPRQRSAQRAAAHLVQPVRRQVPAHTITRSPRAHHTHSPRADRHSSLASLCSGCDRRNRRTLRLIKIATFEIGPEAVNRKSSDRSETFHFVVYSEILSVGARSIVADVLKSDMRSIRDS